MCTQFSRLGLTYYYRKFLIVCNRLKIYAYRLLNARHNSFCRAMLCISAPYAVMRCLCVRLSVCLSVTFVDHVKTNTRIFKFFSPLGSQAILVFPYQTSWRYSDGNPPPLTGTSNAGGWEKRDSGRISGFAAYRSTVLSTAQVVKCEK